MAAYDSAALAYNNVRISALAGNDPAAVQNWSINASILRNQVVAAMDDWITNGYKNDYEEIAAYISEVMARDMSMLKQQYEQDMQNATLTGVSSGQDFYYTALMPATFDPASWPTFTFNIGDYHTYGKSSFDNSGWSASAAGSFMGLFGGGGSSSGSQSRVESVANFGSQDLKISFGIAQFPISRGWFKDTYLMSKTWEFDQTNPDFKGRLLSDGGSPPKGSLPAYPTSIVFINDLNFQFDTNSSAAHFIRQQQQSSASGGGVVSLGFLNLGGSYSHYSQSGYAQHNLQAQWNDQGFTVPGMAIAGFKCHVLSQKCPNPDPGITSWD